MATGDDEDDRQEERDRAAEGGFGGQEARARYAAAAFVGARAGCAW